MYVCLSVCLSICLPEHLLSLLFKCNVMSLGSIYLKNTVTKHWKERDQSDLQYADSAPFLLHTADKMIMRANIVEAIIHAPEIIRYVRHLVGVFVFSCLSVICLCIRRFACWSVCLSLCLSVSLSVCLCAYVSVCLSVCLINLILSVCLFVCLSNTYIFNIEIYIQHH